MERINLKAEGIASTFMRAALAGQSKELGKQLYVDVELRVNGLVIPLVPALDTFTSDLQEAVQQRAVELVLGDDQLARIRVTLQRAALDVQAAVNKLPTSSA